MGTVALSPSLLRRAFGVFPSGVTAVAGLVDGVPVGMTASSFTSVSLSPPLVSVCVAHTSTTWPVLRSASGIGVSVLGEGHASAARVLSSRRDDRFSGLSWSSSGGAVFISGAALWLRCCVGGEVVAGDHVIVLLEVVEVSVFDDVSPLVFHGSGFRGLGLEAPSTRSA